MFIQLSTVMSLAALAQAAVVPRGGYGEIKYRDQAGNCLEVVSSRSGPSAGYNQRLCPGMCPWDQLKEKYGDMLRVQPDGSATIPFGGFQDYTCSAEQAISSGGGDAKFRCIKSCKDNGAYIRIVTYNDQLACQGTDANTCTWYQDDQCQVLQPLASNPTTVAFNIVCNNQFGTGPQWCEEARRVILEGQAPQQCGGSPVVPTCAAPKGGYPYGGSSFRCMPDANNPNQFTPVKITAWKEIACMSHDSVNCIWSTQQCCESMVASSDASTPYMECGHRHQEVYGNTGYELPNSWCSQGKAWFDR